MEARRGSASSFIAASPEGAKVNQEEHSLEGREERGSLTDADARLLVRIRGGDADAGREFVREYYPGVYRYLLSLTGLRQTAEDLTQETFLQARAGGSDHPPAPGGVVLAPGA